MYIVQSYIIDLLITVFIHAVPVVQIFLSGFRKLANSFKFKSVSKFAEKKVSQNFEKKEEEKS